LAVWLFGSQAVSVDGNQKSGENSPVEVKVVEIALFTMGFLDPRVLAPSQVVV